jgi:hypothetical protein
MENAARDSRRFEAAQRPEAGVVVHLAGPPLLIMAIPTDLTERHIARELLWRLRLVSPVVTIVWASSACGGELAGGKWSLGLRGKVVAQPSNEPGP